MQKLLLPLLFVTIGAAPPPEYQPLPGEGVLCLMAFVDVAAEVGRQCYSGQNPEFQAKLESAERRFDAYFLKHGPATPEQLASFKRRQASIGDADASICEGDRDTLYKDFLKAPPNELSSAVDKALARDGKPTFGDCL